MSEGHRIHGGRFGKVNKMREKDFLERFESGMTRKSNSIFTGVGIIFVGTLLLNLGLLAFGIWVIVKLMQHFGVI